MIDDCDELAQVATGDRVVLAHAMRALAEDGLGQRRVSSIIAKQELYCLCISVEFMVGVPTQHQQAATAAGRVCRMLEPSAHVMSEWTCCHMQCYECPAQAAVATYSDITAAEPDSAYGLHMRALFKFDRGDLQVANTTRCISLHLAVCIPQHMAILNVRFVRPWNLQPQLHALSSADAPVPSSSIF